MDEDIRNRYNSFDIERFQSYKGKYLIITGTHNQIISGILLDVSPKNMWLYIKDDNGIERIVPLTNRHILNIAVMDKPSKSKVIGEKINAKK